MQFLNLNSKNNYNQKSLKNKIGLNILVVFSVLLLLVGFNIFPFLNSVFLGVFGLSTYIGFVALIAIGLMMYLDREIVISKKDAALLFAWLFVFGCVLHLTTTLSFVNETFSKYIQTTYLVKTTFGGVFFSLFVYVINLFTHTVASYILYVVALIVLSSVISQSIYQNIKSGSLAIRKTKEKAEATSEEKSLNNKAVEQEQTVVAAKSGAESNGNESALNSNFSKTQAKPEARMATNNSVFVSDDEFAEDFAESSEEIERQRKAEVILGLAKDNAKNTAAKPSRNENMKGTTYAENSNGGVETHHSDFLSSKRPRKFVHDIITSPRKKSKIVEEGKALSETDKKNLDFLRSTIGGRSKTKFDFNENNVLEEKVEDEQTIVEETDANDGFELDDYLTSEIYRTNNEVREVAENKPFNKRPALFTENNELVVSDNVYSENKFNAGTQTILENDFAKPVNPAVNSGFNKQNNNLNSRQTKQFAGSKVPKKKSKYVKPPLELLKRYESDSEDLSNDYQEKAKMLEETLASFKINASVVSVTKGPAFTRFEMQMAHGISVKRVTSYIDDIAMVLESQGAVRVEIPIPGKNAFGVEVPNETISTVGLKDIIESYSFEGSKSKLTFALGKDITGESKVARLEKMPHLLVAGSTGSGKSVSLNSMLISLIYKASPDDLKLILIDPKRVEFTLYNGLPHLLVPNVITDPEKAINALNWTIDEMERRFIKFSKNKVRNLEEYNLLQNVTSGLESKMPYIVVVIDELSDLMMISKKDIEDKIIRIAQKSRAAGIHLVLATQRPSVDVITGSIKANLPSRIAFAVSSFVDSKTILDQGGAEKLLGKGDMLYSPIDMSDSVRIQGAFVSNKEVEDIVDFIKENNEADFDEQIEEDMFAKKQHGFDRGQNEEDFDALFKDAVRFVIKRGSVSISMVQRAFGIGFNRAGRIVDQMEFAGFVSPPDNSKARELYITQQEFEERFGEDL